MSVLTGDEIVAMYGAGRITIDPYNESRVQPNSYDVRLGPLVGTYEAYHLNSRNPPKLSVSKIPDDGLIVWPGQLYICSTVERCGSAEFAPELHGKSTLGRLGLLVHCTAAFGDLGFGVGESDTDWTLEILSLSRPVTLYAGDPIAQVKFTTTLGTRSRQYRGRYSRQRGPTGGKVQLTRIETHHEI